MRAHNRVTSVQQKVYLVALSANMNRQSGGSRNNPGNSSMTTSRCKARKTSRLHRTSRKLTIINNFCTHMYLPQGKENTSWKEERMTQAWQGPLEKK